MFYNFKAYPARSFSIRTVLLFILFHSICVAEILTTNDWNRIETECLQLDSNDLLLFDVDGTLIVPDDAILKPQWKKTFQHLIAKYDIGRDLFREIRMQAPHSTLASSVFLHQLQERQIPIIAFTAAPSTIPGESKPGNWRVQELKRYGFDFTSSFPQPNSFSLSKDPHKTHAPLFNQGVLYSSFHLKGPILLAFLQHLEIKPSKVIFVDDEIEHILSVLSTLENAQIPCLAIHYTAANIPAKLDLDHARFQIEHFVQHNTWLSDK